MISHQRVLPPSLRVCDPFRSSGLNRNVPIDRIAIPFQRNLQTRESDAGCFHYSGRYSKS